MKYEKCLFMNMFNYAMFVYLWMPNYRFFNRYENRSDDGFLRLPVFLPVRKPVRIRFVDGISGTGSNRLRISHSNEIGADLT